MKFRGKLVSIRLPVEEISSQIGKREIEVRGKRIKGNTAKLLCFKNSGITCPNCGRRGAFFRLRVKNEINKYSVLNLYTQDGILMTVDHIIPKVWGGRTTRSNTQSMCFECNNQKGHKIDAILMPLPEALMYQMFRNYNNSSETLKRASKQKI